MSYRRVVAALLERLTLPEGHQLALTDDAWQATLATFDLWTEERDSALLVTARIRPVSPARDTTFRQDHPRCVRSGRALAGPAERCQRVVRGV
jgi:hypothetical protein